MRARSVKSFIKLSFKNLFIAAALIIFVWLVCLYFLTSHPDNSIPPGPKVPLTCEKVSLLYTWVNGSDPEHIVARTLRSGNAAYSHPGNNRFRDLGGLLYSLRSAEKYASWVDGIFVVTSGQIPSFLNLTHPKVHLITHDQLFPNKSDLPTFSSNAIESSFHNLPDSVGDCFIYLNDDMFFANHVTREDFWDPIHGLRLWKSSWTAPPPRSKMSNAWHRSINFSNDLLNKIWGYQYSRNYASHGPYFFSMEVLRRMYEELREAFDATAGHPFRTGEDVSIPFLYNQFAQRYYVTTVESSINLYMKLIDDQGKVEKDLQKILTKQPKTVCMNDFLGDDPNPEVVKGMHTFFHTLFPTKSEFELYEDEYM